MELFWLVVAPNPGVLVAPKAGVAVVAPNAGVVLPKRPPLWVVAVPKGLLNVLLCWLAWPKSPDNFKKYIYYITETIKKPNNIYWFKNKGAVAQCVCQ